MNNTSLNVYSFSPNAVTFTPKPITQEKIETQPEIRKTLTAESFERDYWKYQTACAINNQVIINRNNNDNNNYNIGRNVMNEFYQKYPNLRSFTMAETLAKNAERNNSNPYITQILKNQADKDFNTMIEILEKRPDNKNITFEEYINMIEKEFQEYRFANCGERAYYLHNQMNQKGINNKVIEIGGNSAENSHVFNVIGLDKNADINNPETWGENAVVIDVWTNKLCSPKEALAFYKDFLNYGENNPMQIKELDTDKIFKKAEQ